VGVTDLGLAHDDLRPLMFSVAYRMLGSVAEAEDIVQEAFLRLQGTDLASVRSPDAFATTVTTRLAIDALRSARRRRETYVGPWLPEPLVPERADDPARRIELDESVSLAVLTLMETLNPVERAVFVLRETLDYDYSAIAEIVERTEANCRQLFARARARLDEGRPRFEVDAARRDELAATFLQAVGSGDLEALERLLAEDVAFYGDGGKAPAIRQPMYGATAVARFLLGLARRGSGLGVRLLPAHANGQPALLALDPDNGLLSVLSLDIVDGRIVALRNQLNPDKLDHLGPVGQLSTLLDG